ncbi:MAG: hypothetical protein EPN38_04635 [Rhodanobacteraceae bacterium]|nr:MAG: hypothetical protein EPN38_04635 [Rhodanobacteraceae bacterium]
MNTDTDQGAAGAAEGGVPDERPPPWGEALAAGVGLAAAARRTVAALVALFVAEARVARASIALIVLGGIALIACAVSLWACGVVLAGWALWLATHSLGAALGILVALHLLLVAALWWWLKRVVKRARWPALRTELHALGGQLQQHIRRFERAPPPAKPGPAP